LVNPAEIPAMRALEGDLHNKPKIERMHDVPLMLEPREKENI
jgi:hypothetical protein